MRRIGAQSPRVGPKSGAPGEQGREGVLEESAEGELFAGRQPATKAVSEGLVGAWMYQWSY
eukprot:4871110-Pyramimonas_sp.AAC.1